MQSLKFINNILPTIVVSIILLWLVCASGYAQSTKIDFESDQYLCAVVFTPSEVYHNGDKYEWDFGDGSVSSETTPVHQYSNSGRYSVTLRVTDEHGQQRTKTKRIRFRSDLKMGFTEKSVDLTVAQCEDVIDAELLMYRPTRLRPLDTEPYQGTWKRHEAYEYIAPRENGVFGISSFNPGLEKNALNRWIPKKKPHILDEEDQASYVRTSWLWDKYRQHIIAEAVNANEDEIAFTGFEEQSLTTGNWVFTSEAIQKALKLPLISGYKNFALLEIDPQRAALISSLEVNATDVSGNESFYKSLPVLCFQAYEKNPNWSLFILGGTPHRDLWTGEVQTSVNVSPSITGVQLDRQIKHSGSASLRVTKTTKIEQPLLNLSPSKKYVISLWVSTHQSRMRNTMIDGSGMEVIFMNGKEQVMESIVFKPSGAVIEGWQQINGVFTTPEHFTALWLKLHTNGLSWIDDLRLYPDEGNMRTMVYDPVFGKKSALLDENNRAFLFYYNSEGNLFQQKRETTEGIKTVTENIQYTGANQ